ncbi:MAG: hypothetical protein Q8L27_05140 [archaeon]|nr:hypothetical protein [archaeon]
MSYYNQDSNLNQGMRLRLYKGVIRPEGCISGHYKNHRFPFLRKHQLLSAVGIIISTAFISSFFLPKPNPEVVLEDSDYDSLEEQTIQLSDSTTIPEPYFPLEEITISEPRSNIETIVETTLAETSDKQ